MGRDFRLGPFCCPALHPIGEEPSETQIEPGFEVRDQKGEAMYQFTHLLCGTSSTRKGL